MNNIIDLEQKKMRLLEVIKEKLTKGVPLNLKEKKLYYEIQYAVTNPELIEDLQEDIRLSENLEIIHIQSKYRLIEINEKLEEGA